MSQAINLNQTIGILPPEARGCDTSTRTMVELNRRGNSSIFDPSTEKSRCFDKQQIYHLQGAKKVYPYQTKVTMELTADQLDVWIRENFFAEFSDSEFAKHITKAKDVYVKVRLYFEEHGLNLSLDSLNAVKSLIMSGKAPPAEVKAVHSQGSTTTDMSVLPVTEPVSLASIDAQIKSIEKKALWAIIALFIIILIK